MWQPAPGMYSDVIQDPTSGSKLFFLFSFLFLGDSRRHDDDDCKLDFLLLNVFN